MGSSNNKRLGDSPRGGQARRVGSRRANGVAGRPLKLSRKAEQKARHAVRQRPPLHERLAARVKRETKRLEPPQDIGPSALVLRAVRHLRQAVLPNDPRDVEWRERSGEPVVAFVGAVDLVFLLCVAVLLVVGTVMVFSASMAFAYQNNGSTSYYLLRQTLWLTIGGVGMYLAMRVDYRRWRHVAGVALVCSVVLLLLLHTRFGVDINGARRWLKVSFLELQPSEFAKMGLIVYASHWFANQRPQLRHSLRGLLPFGLVVGVITALVFKQPDLGTTLVILVSLVTIYFVAGARVLHLSLLAVAAAVGVELFLHHMHGYQLTRYLAFRDPYKYANGAGYHYVQLLNALGTGGPTGVGLGNSQAKFTMPEPHTDSIFAIIGEEWGVIGTVGVVALFCLFAWRGLRASMLAPDAFGRLLAAGLTCTIVFQALLNMAVVASVVPFTGVPLPFISYGGSSLSISMVAAGIILNISKQAMDLQEERDPASTYLWWRNRRAHLSISGRRATPRAAGRQAAAVSGRSASRGYRGSTGR